jgi:hypothetical protein
VRPCGSRRCRAMRDDSVVSADLHDRLTSVLGKLASATDEAEAVGVDTGTGTGATSAGNGVSSTAELSRTGTFWGPPVPRTALYRPASRDDFARRLCSFRNAAHWFGKPVTAGPVACARRGWRNAGVDLLECEVRSHETPATVSAQFARGPRSHAALASLVEGSPLWLIETRLPGAGRYAGRSSASRSHRRGTTRRSSRCDSRGRSSSDAVRPRVWVDQRKRQLACDSCLCTP